MEKPVFIISFDCEGKWGLADIITDYGCSILTNENLNSAYQRLIHILDNQGLKATFAFVGAFTLSFDEFMANQTWFKDYSINGKNWLSRFRQDIADKDFEGWLNPTPLEIVERTQQHEISSHGFTHLPLDEYLAPRDAFLHEMKCTSRVSQIKGLSFNTFVYPRNLVGYPHLLGDSGFLGYRGGSDGAQLSRTRMLLDELNIKQGAQPHGILDKNVVKIPSGYFLNWRANLRRMIPFSITVRRWHHAIQNAIKNNKVIHLTTHPQDFIDGDNQYLLLEEILKFVARKQRRNEILNLTLNEYSNMILNNAHTL